MLRKVGAGVLVLAAAAACGDSTGPEDFDPVTTRQKADVVLAAFADNPALLSLAAMDSLSLGGPLLSATVPAAPSVLASRATLLRTYIGSDGPSFGSSSPMAIFPADLLGATFVWNTGQGYVEDPNATGAPANGIRLILYTVNPLTREPVQPLDPRGYLDITDESTVSTDALHLVAVWEDVTYLDYVASAVTTTSSLTLSAEGFVSNGTDQVDFDLTFTVTSTSVSVDYLLTHDQGAVQLTGSITADTIDVVLTVDDGDNQVALDVTITESTVVGTIEYNGDVAVEIGGTPEEPTWTRPDGTPLTQAELAALVAFGELIDEIIGHFDDLLGPALVAFLLG
jgi:hypothetical protein